MTDNANSMMTVADVECGQSALEKRFSPWKRQTVADWFDDRVTEFGEREWIFTLEKSYGYKEGQEIVNNLAKGLLKLGIKRREHVIYIIANLPEILFTRFALAKIGAVGVSVNIMSREEELRYVIKHSDAVAIITMDNFGATDYLSLLRKACPEITRARDGERIKSEEFPLLRHVISISRSGETYSDAIDFHALVEKGKNVSAGKLREVQIASRYPDEICELIYTSGTTGLLKGALLSHDAFLRVGYGNAFVRGMKDGARMFAPVPLNHVAGYTEAMVNTMDVGGCILLQPFPSFPQAYEIIEKGRAEDAFMVPTVLLGLLSHPDKSKYDLSSLKAVTNAAAPTPLPVWKQAVDELNLNLIATGYGQTETHGGTCCVTSVDVGIEGVADYVGRAKPAGSAAIPEFSPSFCQYEVINSETGELLPRGEEGELVCRGPVVMRGYYKNPELNAEVFDKDGWMHTGDVGIVDEHGFIKLTGRTKELYKRGAELVAPREVEVYLSKHPKVQDVYVVGVPDEKYGEVGMAFIELKKGETATQEEIIEYCAGKIASFKIPQYVKFTSIVELPKTTTGKIQKFKLRENAISELGLEGITEKMAAIKKV